MSYRSRSVEPQVACQKALLERGYLAVESSGLRVFAETTESAYGAARSGNAEPRCLGMISGPEVGCARFFDQTSGLVVEVSAHLVWSWNWRDGTKGRSTAVTVTSFLEGLPPLAQC